MYDYTKLQTHNERQINSIVHNPRLEFEFTGNKATSEVYDYPLTATWNNWKIIVFSPNLLEISGSLHKFWNKGNNANDFSFDDVRKSIDEFCQFFSINPLLFTVCNLEFGINIKPSFEAREILEQVVCYRNNRPLRPYESRPSFFFLEFRNCETYVKLYDKGTQCGIGNTLRFELKAIKSRYLAFAGIHSLDDLRRLECMKKLGERLIQAILKMVFKDDTIDLSSLSRRDKETYLLMKDGSEWGNHKGCKNQNQRRKEIRFETLVNKYGKRKLKDHLERIVKEKVETLTSDNMSSVFTPKLYGEKQSISWKLPW